jgi:GntR family transcriptional regulator, negative regulator for fad regulon and positive regulator of fabA
MDKNSLYKIMAASVYPRYLRPAEHAESRLIVSILNGEYQAETYLPAERELAARLGVTRPTLREALQRLERDGWVEIHQGKSTRVRNYLEEGSLAVLSTIAEYTESIPAGFVDQLLEVRETIAPAYTAAAVERHSGELLEYLTQASGLERTAAAYTAYDWELHHLLARLSGNRVFLLILNGFTRLYAVLGLRYFEQNDLRRQSDHFYQELAILCRQKRPDEAGELARRVMHASRTAWNRLEPGSQAT